MAEDNPTVELKLEDIVSKENESISEDERNFLSENKDSLTADEATKFEIQKEKQSEPDLPIEPEVRVKPPETPKPQDKPPDQNQDVLDLDDRKTIGEEVEKIVAPLKTSVQDSKDTTEVDAFIRENPDYAKYRTQMLTYIKHSTYSDVPAGNIAAIVAAKDQQAIGAQRERDAASKVDKTKGGGDSARPTSGKEKDWGTASKEDFQAKQAEVLGRTGA